MYLIVLYVTVILSSCLEYSVYQLSVRMYPVYVYYMISSWGWIECDLNWLDLILRPTTCKQITECFPVGLFLHGTNPVLVMIHWSPLNSVAQSLTSQSEWSSQLPWVIYFHIDQYCPSIHPKSNHWNSVAFNEAWIQRNVQPGSGQYGSLMRCYSLSCVGSYHFI